MVLSNKVTFGNKYIVISLSRSGMAYDNTFGASERFSVLIQKHEVIAFNPSSGAPLCRIHRDLVPLVRLGAAGWGGGIRGEN